MVALAALAYRTVHVSQLLPLPNALYRRIVFDAIGIYLGMALGFRLFLSFVTTEGLDSVRIQTELSLAHGIQATLVPTISFQSETFEIYGQSMPSTEMGGDLIDVIENDGNLLAYVADVSGHGLAAGQLMGMLKIGLAGRASIPATSRRPARECGPCASCSQGTRYVCDLGSAPV